MKPNRLQTDDTVVYVPDEIIRNIDRALDTMEKAQKEFLKITEKDWSPLNGSQTEDKSKNEQ